VVDAGGLDLIMEPRSTPTLLTPHAGELAVLLSRLESSHVPVGRTNVTSEPLAHARRLADLTNSTVLLKGATTLVVPPSPSGLTLRAQADGPSWLATAGSGDVLAGLAGMLLASGLTPLDSGSVAALVHGLAAQAANPGGPVRALGVAGAIPGVVAALLVRRTPRS
jgi:NAD(P)H-hydrate repair Nnr-like enzyme with NAD(P)H-hydrate dehydratase domain